MSVDDPNIPGPPEEPIDEPPEGDIPLPPPPPPAPGLPPVPPPMPIWNDSDASEDEAGWRVGGYGHGDPGDEKPKRKGKRGDEDIYGEARTFEWHEAWIAAVTQPSVATFEALIRDPRASLRRAVLWLAPLMLASLAIQFGIISLFGFGVGDVSVAWGSSLMLLICAPVGVVIGFVLLVIGWGSQHLAAKVLGGKGTFEQLFYANSCYYAPLMVAGFAAFVPCLGTLIMIGLGLYQLVLNVISVRAVHRLDTGRAVIATFWLILLMCGCMICALLVIAPSTAGLREIIDTLITPTP